MDYIRACRWTLLGCLVPLLAGCYTTSIDPTRISIVEEVQAVPAAQFDRVCIEVDGDVKSDFTDGLFEAIKELGFATQSRQSAFGDECRHWMRYSAGWGGFPEHLLTADLRVFDGNKKVGQIRYDASKAGKRPDQYGSAMGKLKPLLEALFVRVERGS